MLKIKCEKCKKILKTSGALVISTPMEDCDSPEDGVYRYHICYPCYTNLESWLFGYSKLVPIKKSY